MMRCLVLVVVALGAGCQQPMLTPAPGASEPGLFQPVEMRLLPTFTQIRDWTADGRVDGIEALVEFTDRFSDPTKATGKLVFELFEFRSGPDSRGDRVINPWIGSLTTIADQRQHWAQVSRAYSFLLAYPGVDPSRRYVLTVTFEPVDGDRLFDRVILEPSNHERRRHVTPPPATQPARGPAAP